MYKIFIAIVVLLSFNGCFEKKNTSNLDGEKLIKEKCSSCHNLDLPPKTYEGEIAPPMMAVSFHIIDFIKVNVESQKIPKAIDFVKDYVINPDRKKSFCDKESLKHYGVMPSQKGKVTQDELQAIAEYMFSHFTLRELNKAQEAINRLNAMPEGERLAIKYKCVTCHKKKLDIVGPSLKRLAQKYANSPQIMKQSILNGSRGKWKSSKGAIMPAFKIDEKDIDKIVKWINSTN